MKARRPSHGADSRYISAALALIAGFMIAEVIAGILAS
jgi:Co/Zn/Cd efflux system component